MEKPSSSSRSTKAKASNDANTSFGGLGMLNEHLLQNILAKLPALSFASAACVCKFWNSISNRILSRPKLSSALFLNPSLHDAVNEALHKVLSEPIRPYFAIVNVENGFDLSKTMQLIRGTLGFNIPVIVTRENGIIGRDALTNEFKEVNWGDLFSGFTGEAYARNLNEGIVLTVGYLPGLKVEAIPFLRPPKEASSDMKPVMEKLDYAMPKDTVNVGDEGGCFIYRSRNDSRNTCGRRADLEAVALVFA